MRHAAGGRQGGNCKTFRCQTTAIFRLQLCGLCLPCLGRLLRGRNPRCRRHPYFKLLHDVVVEVAHQRLDTRHKRPTPTPSFDPHVAFQRNSEPYWKAAWIIRHQQALHIFTNIRQQHGCGLAPPEVRRDLNSVGGTAQLAHEPVNPASRSRRLRRLLLQEVTLPLPWISSVLSTRNDLNLGP